MRTALVAAVLFALTSAAQAGKPTQAQAKKAAKAWLAALKGGDAPKADALAAASTVPFTSGAFYLIDTTCPLTTTEAADKLGAVFDCLAPAVDEIMMKAKIAAFRKGDENGPSETFRNAVPALRKKMTLVTIAHDCHSNASQELVLGVVKDDKGAVKIAAALVETDLCGE
jgi:hypothetical protein